MMSNLTNVRKLIEFSIKSQREHKKEDAPLVYHISINIAIT